ncbi:hypothetical protein BMS3Bbin04_00407 [bacterium BMS3Bbin04]|nr:hypothetical protein BMS3Bbin04_00407 [bacterium BMS3Bbin04]
MSVGRILKKCPETEITLNQRQRVLSALGYPALDTQYSFNAIYHEGLDRQFDPDFASIFLAETHFSAINSVFPQFLLMLHVFRCNIFFIEQKLDISFQKFFPGVSEQYASSWIYIYVMTILINHENPITG